MGPELQKPGHHRGAGESQRDPRRRNWFLLSLVAKKKDQKAAF